MPVFSEKSLQRLGECHEDLQRVLRMAVEVMDFKVLQGHRGEAEQNKAFAEGKSKLQWPNSKHNQLPAQAVDVAPYPIDWEDRRRFHELAGVIKGIAHALGVQVKWGGNWERFKDYPHFELSAG